MSRKIIDCRDMPNDSGCTLRISGEPDEVMRVAVMHAVDAHGHQDGDELRKALRNGLKDDQLVR